MDSDHKWTIPQHGFVCAPLCMCAAICIMMYGDSTACCRAAGGPKAPPAPSRRISPKARYFCGFLILFTLMVPSETVGPPGGRHKGAAVKMHVPTLGSVRRPVASTPAPGAVGTWTRISEHGPSKMFIFTMFYKGKYYDRDHSIQTCFPTVSEHACSELIMRSAEIACFGGYMDGTWEWKCNVSI